MTLVCMYYAILNYVTLSNMQDLKYCWVCCLSFQSSHVVFKV